MYWSPYEYNYEKNSYMPEDEWQANIDWVAANLKNYGYTLVSTDGWMTEHDLRVCNEYGYVSRASINWQHDYAYWADYCRSKGLQLGIYGNPLWVPREVAQSGLKIKGTDIPVANIVDLNEYRNGHQYNWVQLDREGAEAWEGLCRPLRRDGCRLPACRFPLVLRGRQGSLSSRGCGARPSGLDV